MTTLVEVLTHLRDCCHDGCWGVEDLHLLLNNSTQRRLLEQEARRPSSAVWDMIYWHAPPPSTFSNFVNTFPVDRLAEWFAGCPKGLPATVQRLYNLLGGFQVAVPIGANPDTHMRYNFLATKPIVSPDGSMPHWVKDGSPLHTRLVRASVETPHLEAFEVFTLHMLRRHDFHTRRPHFDGLLGNSVRDDKRLHWLHHMQSSAHRKQTKHLRHIIPATASDVIPCMIDTNHTERVQVWYDREARNHFPWRVEFLEHLTNNGAP